MLRLGSHGYRVRASLVVVWININFLLKYTTFTSGLSGRGIFSTFALMNHSCIGNARFTVDSKQHIRVEAKQDIKEGEEITVQYYR